MNITRPHLMAVTIGIGLAYVVSGPTIAGLATPLFNTAPSGSCTGVTTDTGCCAVDDTAIGAAWEPIHAALMLPARTLEQLGSGTVSCMCERLPVRQVPTLQHGRCMMDQQPRDLRLELYCSDEATLLVRNGARLSATLGTVAIDGETVAITPDQDTVIEAGGIERLAVGSLGAGNHTVTATISYPGVDGPVTTSQILGCS